MGATLLNQALTPMGFFLPQFQYYDSANVNDDLHPTKIPHSPTQHLFTCTTWKGLSSLQAEELALWEALFRSELERKLQDLITLWPYIRTTQITIDVDIPNTVVKMIGEYSKLYRGAPRLLSPAQILRFVQMQDCLTDRYQDDTMGCERRLQTANVHVSGIDLGSGYARATTVLPLVSFQDLEVEPSEGQNYYLKPNFVPPFDSMPHSVTWTTTCDWLRFNGSYFQGTVPQIKNSRLRVIIKATVTHLLDQAHGNALNMRPKVRRELCVWARVTILPIPTPANPRATNFLSQHSMLSALLLDEASGRCEEDVGPLKGLYQNITPTSLEKATTWHVTNQNVIKSDIRDAKKSIQCLDPNLDHTRQLISSPRETPSPTGRLMADLESEDEEAIFSTDDSNPDHAANPTTPITEEPYTSVRLSSTRIPLRCCQKAITNITQNPIPVEFRNSFDVLQEQSDMDHMPVIADSLTLEQKVVDWSTPMTTENGDITPQTGRRPESWLCPITSLSKTRSPSLNEESPVRVASDKNGDESDILSKADCEDSEIVLQDATMQPFTTQASPASELRPSTVRTSEDIVAAQIARKDGLFSAWCDKIQEKPSSVGKTILDCSSLRKPFARRSLGAAVGKQHAQNNEELDRASDARHRRSSTFQVGVGEDDDGVNGKFSEVVRRTFEELDFESEEDPRDVREMKKVLLEARLRDMEKRMIGRRVDRWTNSSFGASEDICDPVGDDSGMLSVIDEGSSTG